MTQPAAQTLPKGYLSISLDYSYAPMRVGTAIRHNATGQDVYFQPGDASNGIRDIIEALDELPDDKIDAITNIALEGYFA